MARIRIKKLRANSILPTKAFDTDVGYDLYASTIKHDFLHGQIVIGTGVAIQPESGYYVELMPRSSIHKYKLQLANSIGVIDPTYTGELILVFDYLGEGKLIDILSEGDRVAQLVVRKQHTAEFEEVKELSMTLREDGGFGSTGVK